MEVRGWKFEVKYFDKPSKIDTFNYQTIKLSYIQTIKLSNKISLHNNNKIYLEDSTDVDVFSWVDMNEEDVYQNAIKFYIQYNAIDKLSRYMYYYELLFSCLSQGAFISYELRRKVLNSLLNPKNRITKIDSLIKKILK